MSRIVAVIPARGSSKGIPYKNIQKIAGKPLIAYTIESALKSTVLDRVIVSTDDSKIAQIAKSCGAEVPFLRPADLAMDNTPGFRVAQHAVKYLEDFETCKVDVAVILQPTSPLRGERHINATVEKLLETNADSVVTVCKVKRHPFWSFLCKGDRLYPFLEEGITVSRRQDLPEIYALNGAVYAVKRQVLFEQNSLLGKDTRAVVMSDEESVDVDDYFDLFLAEMTIKHWKRWTYEKSENRK